MTDEQKITDLMAENQTLREALSESNRMLMKANEMLTSTD